MGKSNINVQASEDVSYDSMLKRDALLKNREQINIRQICDVIDDVIKIAGRQDIKILEIGFGDGRHMRQLSEIYSEAKFTGLEVRTKPVKKMVELGFDCRLVETERFDVFFNTAETFDIVYGYGALHHMSDPKKSLESLIEILNPNGVVIFIREHHRYDLLSHLYATIRRSWVFEKNTFKMTRKRLKKVLSRNSNEYYIRYDNNAIVMCFERFNSIYNKLKLNRFPLMNGMTIYAKKGSSQEGNRELGAKL